MKFAGVVSVRRWLDVHSCREKNVKVQPVPFSNKQTIRIRREAMGRSQFRLDTGPSGPFCLEVI